jgi:predicted nucleic acid-binding protein
LNDAVAGVDPERLAFNRLRLRQFHDVSRHHGAGLDVTWTTARLDSCLRPFVATIDPLIATAAGIDGAPPATRNTRHYSRVPGLTVEKY